MQRALRQAIVVRVQAEATDFLAFSQKLWKVTVSYFLVRSQNCEKWLLAIFWRVRKIVKSDC
jgi:hypothetical protein